MTPDLYQLVDMTRPEADGLTGFVEVDNDGRHLLPLYAADGACEKCPAAAELVDGDNGAVIETEETYRMGARGSPPLCREHLAEEPTHLGFKPVGDEEVSRQ